MKAGKALLFILMILSVLAKPDVVSASAKPTCDDGVTVIYVRGSGEKIDTDQYLDLRKTLEGKIENVNIFELKKGIPGAPVSANYEARAIVGTTEAMRDGLVAILDGGSIGAYNDSLNSGVTLLASHLNSGIYKENSCIALVGYSQGAHVIGETLRDIQNNSVADNIIYVGLLGDPKLDLMGYSWQVGKDVPWYRGNAVPLIQEGLLGARRPDYIPRLSPSSNLTFTKVGSWCYDDDLICTSNFVGGVIDNGHSKYRSRALPQLAQEIANEVNQRALGGGGVVACGASKQDVVLAVNLSPSMRTDDVFLSAEGIDKTVKDVFKSGCDVRVGLVGFGREGIDAVELVLDFTNDPNILRAALSSQAAVDKTSYVIEKSDVLGGVSTALDFMWRDDAQKAVMVISNSGGSDLGMSPYMFENNFPSDYRVRDILQKSREDGGVEIYAIKMLHRPWPSRTNEEGMMGFYDYVKPLVAATGGQYGDVAVCGDCNWHSVGGDFSIRLYQKPAVVVAPIRIRAGQVAQLQAVDVSGGVINSSTRYRWYVKCNDVGSGFNGGPLLEYTFSNTGDCYGAVAVNNSVNYCYRCHEGLIEQRFVAAFRIEVLPENYTPPPVPGPIQNLTKERLWDNDTVKISWEAPANSDQTGELAYIIRDSDGNVLGATRSTRLYITDVKDSESVTVLINATSANGQGAVETTEDADDISGPMPTQDATAQIKELEATYGVSRTEATSAPANFNGVALLETAVAQSTVLGMHTTTPSLAKSLASDTIKTPNTNIWIQLSIVAMPLAAAVALGFSVKYGLLLKSYLKR